MLILVFVKYVQSVEYKKFKVILYFVKALSSAPYRYGRVLKCKCSYSYYLFCKKVASVLPYQKFIPALHSIFETQCLELSTAVIRLCVTAFLSGHRAMVVVEVVYGGVIAD